MSNGETRQASGWGARPWVARFLRALVFVLPFAASVAFVWAVSRVVAAPDGTVGFIGWWVALSAGGSAVLFAVDRVARRLLPLTALLRLSLVFPDQAPSRFKAALEAGRVTRLEDRVALMRRAREASTASASAELLLTLVAALSAHDKITRGHSERVRAYSVMIGEELGLSAFEIDQLNWAALLHDVGKLEVSGDILNKPGRPTDDEWEQLKRHPLLGEQLVEPMRAWLGEWADAVGYHHEHFNGKGYPRGLAGEAIPLPGRIVAIADVFDVMTSARSYKEPGSPDAARQEIARCAGTQFDPRMVRAFLNVSLGRMRIVMGPLSWLAHLPILGRLPLAPVASSVWGAIGVAVATTATGLAGAHAPGPDAPVRAALAQTSSRPADHAAAQARKAREQRAAPPAWTTILDRPLHRTVAGTPANVLVAPGAGNAAVDDPSTADPADTAPAPGHALTPTPAPAHGTAPTPAPADDLMDTPPLTREPADVPAADALPAPVGLAPDPLLPNHAPSFAAGADQTVLEDSGAHAIIGWASAISPGPANESAQTVSFLVSNDDSHLFSAQPAVSSAGTLTYTPAPDAHGTATVIVNAVDDGGTADGGNNTSAPQTFTITIGAVNDAPVFAPGSDQTVVKNSAASTITSWASGISPGPADESGQTITFAASNDNPGLFAGQPAVSPNGTLTFTPAAGATGSATVIVHAVDDGGTGAGGTDTSAPQAFVIAVVKRNNAPSFTAGADQNPLEDSGAGSVAGWASAISPGPADDIGQNVSFLVTNDNPGLFSAQPAISAAGTLMYMPAADANGAATVTIRAVDDGGTAHGGSDTSAPQTSVITVTAVNDAPSFTAGGDQGTLINTGQQTIPGWASAISAGPANENGQNVSFAVSNDNPGLFTMQPQVTPNGTLVYQPALLALGTATVTVRIVDDGGTANGGVDTSGPQTFTITVIL